MSIDGVFGQENHLRRHRIASSHVQLDIEGDLAAIAKGTQSINIADFGSVLRVTIYFQCLNNSSMCPPAWRLVVPLASFIK